MVSSGLCFVQVSLYICLNIYLPSRWRQCVSPYGINYYNTVQRDIEEHHSFKFALWLACAVITSTVQCQPLNDLHSHMWTYLEKNTLTNSFHIFRQQGNFAAFFELCWIVSVLYSTKCCLFHNFILFCSDNTFFIIHALKYNYQSCHLKVCLCLH
jgi:hypothetical protein